MAQYGEVRVDYITYTTGTVPTEANATVTVSSLVNDPTFSGDVQVGGDVTVTGNLNVSGDSLFNGITVSGNSVLNTLTVTGGSNLEDVEISGTLTVTGTTNLESLQVSGGLTVTGDTNLNTLTATGAANLESLQVSGGLTVTGNTNFNTLTVTGATNLESLQVSGGLTVTGDTNLNTLTVTGNSNLEDVEISGTLTVTGDATISGNLTVSGDLNASGVTVSGITGLFASGSRTTPSISFVNDQNTGIYNSADGGLTITANATNILETKQQAATGSNPTEIVTISGTTNLSYSKQLRNTSTNGWWKLGNWNGLEQGARLKIVFLGCEGFGQQGPPYFGDSGGETIIYASILNNQRTDVANVNGFIYSYGTTCIRRVKFVETTNKFSYEVYADLNSFTRAGYRVETSIGNFTWDLAGNQTDPGPVSTTIAEAVFAGTAKTFELGNTDIKAASLGVGTFATKGNLDVSSDHTVSNRLTTDAYIRNNETELHISSNNNGSAASQYAEIQSQISGTTPTGNLLALNVEYGGQVSIGQIPNNGILFTTSISGQNNTQFIDRTPYTLTGNTYHGSGPDAYITTVFNRSSPEPEFGFYDSVASENFFTYRIPNNNTYTTNQPVLSLLEGSQGNVGINLRNPKYPLTIWGPTQSGINLLDADLDDVRDQRASIALLSNTTTNGTGGAVLFGNTQSNGADSLGYAAIKGALDNGAGKTTGSLLFQTRTDSTQDFLSTKMLLNSQGNLGIGTNFIVPRSGLPSIESDVQASLHVKGDVQFNNLDIVCPGSQPATNPWVKLGTWYASEGARLKLDFLGGESYGAPYATGGEGQLVLSCNNNAQATSLNANGFWNYSGRKPFREVKLVQVGSNRNIFGIYILWASFAVDSYIVTAGLGNGDTRSVYVREDLINQADPGADSATVRAIYPAIESIAQLDRTPPNVVNFKVNGTIEPVNGITFGTTGGTVTSKTLDDYEEGTWTPVLTAATPGNSTWVPLANANGGAYVKVGNKVFVSFNLRGAWTVGTGSGMAILTGLPYTVINRGIPAGAGSSAEFPACIPWLQGLNVPAGTEIYGGLGVPNTNEMNFISYTAGAAAKLDISVFGAGVNIHGSMTYLVA